MLMESEAIQRFVLERDWWSAEKQQEILGLNPPDMSSWMTKMPKVEWKNPLSGASGLKVGSWTLPSLPRVNLRLPNMGPVAGSGAEPPSLSVAGMILVVVLVGGAVVVVALLLLGTRWMGAAKTRPWSPGPWPVDPSRISTRGELVQAFNYLALLLLGRQAEHLNHKEIATQVGDAAPPADVQSHQAADQLARLYEQARYAPGEEMLSPEDMRQARADLSSLAGAARA
jgi:hypothetical protein